MEKGIPTVMIISEDFVVMARMVARSKGVNSPPFVVLPRTINSMSVEEVEAVIEKHSAEIAGLLTAK